MLDVILGWDFQIPLYITPAEQFRRAEEIRRQREVWTIAQSCKADLNVAAAEARAARRIIAAAASSTDPFDMAPLLRMLDGCLASLEQARRHLPRIVNKVGFLDIDSRTRIIVNLMRETLSVEADKCAEVVTQINSIVTSPPRTFDLPNTVSMISRCLMVLAMLGVHTVDRARYHEEWTAELAELADEPRRTQLAYALRLLLHSVRLRSSPLPAPATKSAR